MGETLDILNQPISGFSEDAEAQWNRTIRSILFHHHDASYQLGAVLQSNPDSVLLRALEGLISLMQGTKMHWEVARELASSLCHLPTHTEREQAYAKALARWLAGYPTEAVQVLDALLANTQGDALTLRLSYSIRLMLGDPRGMLHLLQKHLPSYSQKHFAYPHLLGCLAFAHEEMGTLDLAERLVRQALDLEPHDPWSFHALLHVHASRQTPTAGLSLFDEFSSDWLHVNNLRFHLHWHRALFFIESGQPSDALDLYDKQVRAEKCNEYRDFANAASLLCRLALRGVEVGKRWEELADVAISRSEDCVLLFADAHYALALWGAGRTCDLRRLAENSKCSSTEGPKDELEQLREAAGVPLLSAISSLCQGQASESAVHFKRALPQLHLLGGSNAQREVFTQLLKPTL